MQHELEYGLARRAMLKDLAQRWLTCSQEGPRAKVQRIWKKAENQLLMFFGANPKMEGFHQVPRPSIRTQQGQNQGVRP